VTALERRSSSPAMLGALHRRFSLAETPAGIAPLAGAAWLGRQALEEWFRTPLYRLTIARPRAESLAAAPRDLRLVRPEGGAEILDGRFVLGGEAMEIGREADPWDRACPSLRFAVALHRFAWLPDLIAAGEPGGKEALRLFLLWRAMFVRPGTFAWAPDTLERRVFNLACAGRRLTEGASDAERSDFANLLAMQARHLLRWPLGPVRAAERAAAAATAGAALGGAAGEQLMEQALARLSSALTVTVLPDGGVKSRSPEAALELLFDLLTVDEGLQQRGREAPVEVSRAIDRLTGAVRFFTLGDGRLASFHGGGPVDRARIAAATAHDDAPGRRPFGYAPHSGYHRLTGQSLQILVDAAPAARGAWSVEARAQPLALEISAGRDRLVVNADGGPETAAWASRLTEAGSTASLGDASVGAVLRGFAAQALGPRLLRGAGRVEARRNESAAGAWLELCHDGWVRAFGLLHERRLYLDPALDELRGEERFAQAAGARPMAVPFAIRFHLHPDVQVSLARDNRSALLRGPSNRGWRLRSDAATMSLEASAHFEDGRARRTGQIVLRGETAVDTAVRVRWKLSPVESADASAVSAQRKQTTPSPASDAKS